MRQLFCVFVALVCASAGAGVGRWDEVQQAKKIDPKKSAALFVGIRDFSVGQDPGHCSLRSR